MIVMMSFITCLQGIVEMTQVFLLIHPTQVLKCDIMIKKMRTHSIGKIESSIYKAWNLNEDFTIQF